MEQQQLPAEEVQQGRTIFLFRIHVERAIRRIKSFRFLKDSFLISMARLANCVCLWLAHELSVPDEKEAEVDDYFHAFD